jgi:transcriptional regulator with XRE-family HTH domain
MTWLESKGCLCHKLYNGQTPLPRNRTQATRAPDATDVAVGRNIRAHRLARRMAQMDLAARIGVTFQQLQKYENGRNRVVSSRLARLAAVFAIPVGALFEGAGEGAGRGRGGASPLALIAAKEPLRLVQAFARIADDKARRSIVQMVEDVAEMVRAPRRRDTKRPPTPPSAERVVGQRQAP